jgi:preprotein translocase subunit SecG
LAVRHWTQILLPESSLSTIKSTLEHILGIIGTFLLVIFAVAAVLIIILVLLQDEQGEGFGGLFGGGGSSTPFGASSGNVLVKATTVLGVLFMVTSLAVAITYKSGEPDNVISESRQAAGTGQDWFLEEPADGAQ